MTKRLFLFIFFVLCTLNICAQEDNQIPFNGLVVDLLGQPIRAVKVYTIDRNFSTVSDRKGRFGLTNVQPDDTLHLVYRRQHYDIPVEGRRSMHIVLGDQCVFDSHASEELENLGYGYVSRRESVSSSQGISGEVLRRTGHTRILDALQGLVPGLTITINQMGEPTVVIRGANSLMCETSPLYVVDDMVVSTLEFVSIYDVESVEVMKDAFIYGSRGANGAILVTTKSGSSK